LSIIVPTYRRNTSLLKLMQYLKVQFYSNTEVVVVDQNEIGFLRRVLPTELLKDVHHLYSEEPNVSKARNLGFVLSRGEYILFIDDDLQPDQDFCKRAVEVFKCYPTISCLCPVAYFYPGKQLALSQLKRIRLKRRIPGTSLCQIKQIHSGAVFFRRDYFIQSGGYDEFVFRYARTAEDQELSFRMRKRGMCIWMDESLFIFHDESVPGGCDLRTQPYWATRERCVKSWALRYRLHSTKVGRLSLQDIYHLSRSSFLNRGILKLGLTRVLEEARLLLGAVRDSDVYMKLHLKDYADVRQVNYLAPYFREKEIRTRKGI